MRTRMPMCGRSNQEKLADWALRMSASSLLTSVEQTRSPDLLDHS